MEAIVERCAGLDVHQASVVACVLIGAPGRKPRKEIRTFGTMTRDLEALRDWLEELGVSHVGMESTGVSWQPVHTILEGRFTRIVGNAHHIKAVPGRKTDVKDAEWLADLVRHGLIKPSFVPPPAIRELRDLVRLRRSLAEARATGRSSCSRPPISSWPVSPARCSASPAWRCSKRWSRTRWRRPRWPSSREARCAASASR
jgi:hypothetical protein